MVVRGGHLFDVIVVCACCWCFVLCFGGYCRVGC